MAAASASSSGAVGVACGDAAFATAKGIVSEASFSSAKLAMLKTIYQNFVLTMEQVAGLVDEVSMSSDKMEALDIFAANVLDPSNSACVVDLFSMSSDKEEAAAKVAEWAAATAGEQAAFAIEDDGHRSSDDMDRLLAAIDGASMSDDKVEVAQKECEDHPSPPFDADQLISVLDKFSFSSDKVKVLDFFAGPAIVYPMSCEDIIRVLSTLSMSSDQMEVLPSLKPFIKDPQNKLSVVASFSFSSDKEKAEEILRDVVVRLVPPEPPVEAIQAALQKIGKCPSGYAWRQVGGGWRCAAGGHYVSDAAVKAAV
jgi:hypothetical protein